MSLEQVLGNMTLKPWPVKMYELCVETECWSQVIQPHSHTHKICPGHTVETCTATVTSSGCPRPVTSGIRCTRCTHPSSCPITFCVTDVLYPLKLMGKNKEKKNVPFNWLSLWKSRWEFSSTNKRFRGWSPHLLSALISQVYQTVSNSQGPPSI